MSDFNFFLKCHIFQFQFSRQLNDSSAEIYLFESKTKTIFYLFFTKQKYPVANVVYFILVDISFWYFCFRIHYFRKFFLTLDIDRSLRSQLLQKQKKKVIWKKKKKIEKKLLLSSSFCQLLPTCIFSPSIIIAKVWFRV